MRNILSLLTILILVAWGHAAFAGLVEHRSGDWVYAANEKTQSAMLLNRAANNTALMLSYDAKVGCDKVIFVFADDNHVYRHRLDDPQLVDGEIVFARNSKPIKTVHFEGAYSNDVFLMKTLTKSVKQHFYGQDNLKIMLYLNLGKGEGFGLYSLNGFTKASKAAQDMCLRMSKQESFTSKKDEKDVAPMPKDAEFGKLVEKYERMVNELTQ